MTSLLERLRASGCALCEEAAGVIEQLRTDLREQEREFQREAREIAAEARWEAQQADEYGSY